MSTLARILRALVDDVGMGEVEAELERVRAETDNTPKPDPKPKPIHATEAARRRAAKKLAGIGRG